MKKLISTLLWLAVVTTAQSNVWVADNGDGTYLNPIVHADYSDPDLIRVDDDYYMVSSSFNCAPGIPVLHSKDLVNWTIINHVYTNLPQERFKDVVHGGGSWAPSIRYHNKKFYVYFCTPDEGLFVATTNDPRERWELRHMLNVRQWEDPCPFWDDDGSAWLVRSKLCGGPVYLHRMSSDGMELLDNGKIVYLNTKENPVLEGLKMMKRNGYYYIFAPAGGVSKGWQSVLRSKSIDGPYESRRVLDEGNGINGPHQGGLVDTKTGEWWFIHFQDKGAYGRILHLQPAKWLDNDWIVIGDDPEGDGCGVPVLTHKKPNVGKSYKVATPQTTDEFSDGELGLQWQWHGAPQRSWYSLSANKGEMRLYPIASPSDDGALYYTPNLLLQKFPAPSFMATTKINASALQEGERAGLVTMGVNQNFIAIEKRDGRYKLIVYSSIYKGCGSNPKAGEVIDLNVSTLYLRVNVTSKRESYYSYSEDGKSFKRLENQTFKINKGKWIGGKIGLYCINPNVFDGKGYVDFDYFRVEQTNE